jgi:hypothetical protein
MTSAEEHHNRGFTLLEALLAAVVLAGCITAVTMPLTVAIANERDESRQILATSLAQELMEEILAQPFYDPQGASQPGPEVGETDRSLFDNVDDYDGYYEPPGSIVTMGGQTVGGIVADSLSRGAAAKYVYVSGQQTDSSPDFARVTVTVKHGNRSLVSLTRLVYACGD